MIEIYFTNKDAIRIWGRWWLKQVAGVWINKYVPRNTVGAGHFFTPQIPTFDTTIVIYNSNDVLSNDDQPEVSKAPNWLFIYSYRVFYVLPDLILLEVMLQGLYRYHI